MKGIVEPKGKSVANSEIKYGTSADECTKDESPTVQYVSDGEKTVYFKINATNYYPAAGSAKVKITPRTVALDWNGKDAYTYNGQAQGPGATIKSTSIVGSDKVGVTVKYKAKGANDSTLTDKKPVDAGEYIAVAVELTGDDKANYQLPKETTKEFAIKAKGLDNDTDDDGSEDADSNVLIALNPAEYTYDGTAKEPTVTVTDKDTKQVVPQSEYTVTYSDNVNAGTAKVKITDVPGGNYNVVCSASFTIARRKATVTAVDQQVKAVDAVKKGVEAVKTEGLAKQQTLKSVKLNVSVKAGAKKGKIVPEKVKIADAKGNDVTRNYELSYVAGGLTLTQKPEPKPEPAKSDYTLLAVMKTCGNRALRMSWTRVPGADGYEVTFVKEDCSFRKAEVVSVRSLNTCKFTGLKKNTPYKAYVRAWKDKGSARIYIGRKSPVVCAITGDLRKHRTNADRVCVDASRVKLNVGERTKVSATVKGVKQGKKVMRWEHALLCWYSSNANVAVVNAKGEIRAVGAGECTVYALAANGVRGAVKVKVK